MMCAFHTRFANEEVLGESGAQKAQMNNHSANVWGLRAVWRDVNTIQISDFSDLLKNPTRNGVPRS